MIDFEKKLYLFAHAQEQQEHQSKRIELDGKYIEPNIVVID